MPSRTDAGHRGAIRTATVAAILLLLVAAGLLFALSRAFGTEPGRAWVCGDTHFTQLVPTGRAVVGGPVTPPPGCIG